MKVLAYTSPARGHLFPLVPTLDELRERGHTVAVCTLSSQVQSMAGHGFAAEAVAPAIEAVELDDYRGRTPVSAARRTMATFGARAKLEVADVRAAIARHEPDALLVDCLTWGATAVAEAWGGPWAQWHPYPIPLSSPEVPPFGPGLRPARGPAGRARDALLRPAVAATFDRAALPRVNAARRAAGVPPLRKAAELFTTPPLLLYMTAEPFEYHRSDWPSNIRMIGPGAWDPRPTPPPWLAELKEPLILVSTSSEFQDDGRLARAALDALAEEDVSVLVTMPAADLPTRIPANARVERFVPHGPVLARAACAVTHGGAGATQKALNAGVPVCVVPFGRDQLEVARRVEVAGAGTFLPLRRLGPKRLRKGILEAMSKREGALRVAAGYAATGGAAAAAEAFERLVAGWPATAAGD